MSNAYPVFYDPTGRRGQFVSAINWTAVSLVSALFCFVGTTILAAPELPGLRASIGDRLGAAHKGLRAPADEPTLDQEHPRALSASAAASVLRYGYLVNWDDNSFASLKRNAASLDVAIVEWLHLADADGGLEPDDARVETNVRTWAKSEAPALKLMPLVNNFDERAERWLSDETGQMLASPAARGRFAHEVSLYLENGSYPGLVLDLEEIRTSDRVGLTLLVEELAKVLKRDGRTLIVAVRPNDEAYDYQKLAGAADGLILMLYDEHQEEGPPGPLAGQGWFEGLLDKHLRDIDPSKLIISIGSYGHDWGGASAGKEISFQEALELQEESGSPLEFDSHSLNPGFAYVGEDGLTHEVWYLDGVTAFNHLAAALTTRPAGLALWRLGTEDPSVWAIFGRGRIPDVQSLPAVKTLKPGYDLLYTGQGEALTFSGSLKDGAREITFDQQHYLLTDERVTAYPKGATIRRWGARPEKVVALTFDDGPDPRYTPKILDILAEKRVKATFFVVGSAGSNNRALLRRLYDEGHDLGNHTFSHVNSADVSVAQLKIELNATQRLIEATTGARTRLFRPPFAQDMEPETIAGTAAMGVAAELGYTTIGMRIDPKDWMRPLAGQIVASVIESVSKREGNVILLHDAGGIRTSTVEALPRLIDELRAQGFSFVTIHELLKLPRSEVMPPVEQEQQYVTTLNSIGFYIFSGSGKALVMMFELGILLGTARLIIVAVTGYAHSRHDARRLDSKSIKRSVAVIIPAFNEEAVICKSIRAMLASRMTKFEIIVVDDGSSDGTSDVVRSTFARTSRVRVLRKPNGGKAEALNYGLRHTSAEIVVALDADTIFHPEAMGWLLRRFDDPRVAAVAGATVVGNTDNLITRFQALEYVTSQNLDRRALELVNSITVVPGAIGAWRRKAIVAAGGYSSETLAEDADLTIRLERLGWRVCYEPNAVARTEAPDTIAAFVKQRFRWMFGTLQAAFKHRGALMRYRNGTGVGLFGLPNIIIFQFLFALISPVIDVYFAWSIYSGIRAYEMRPAEGIPADLTAVAAYWALFQILDVLTAAVAVSIDKAARVWRFLPLLLIQRFCYRQLLYFVAIKTVFAVVNGQMVGWGKLKRTNTVALNLAGAH